MSADEKVVVRVQARGEWSYCQDVEMTRAEYDKYDKALDSDDRHVRRGAEREIVALYANARDMEFDDFKDELDDFCIISDDGDA